MTRDENEQPRRAPRYALTDLVRDVCGFGGVALITTGTAMIHVPAALIVAGALLFYMARGGLR